jgi:uncharacterized protein (DUF58 family)
MPAPRFFLLLGGLTVLVVGAVALPALALLVLAADVLLLAAMVFDLYRARGSELKAHRAWPTLLSQGQGAELQVEVRNPSPRAQTVVLREGLHPALAAGPCRHRRTLPAATLFHWPVPLSPRLRGTYPCAPLTARVLGPWGLAWSQRTLLPGEDFRVFPQIRWQGRVGQLLAQAQRHQLGQMPFRWQGAGLEPYGVRDYLPGDPLNSIHWKATARHGRLISREHSWERGARLVILLDSGRAMMSSAVETREAGRSKLDYALAAALALTRVASGRGDRITLIAFSDRIQRVVGVGSGGRALARAYGALYDLQASLREPAFDLAAEKVFELESRSATVMLLTSIVDLAAAELLRGSLLHLERRHRPLLVNLTDPELATLADQAPQSLPQAFAQTAALEIHLANRSLGRRLGRAGIRVVSTPADRLALETLEAYLALFRGRRSARRRAVG